MGIARPTATPYSGTHQATATMPGDDTDPPTDAETAPGEAFALVGNETRAEIVRVLGEAGRETLPFSELRSRAAVDADSSRFNYHLQKLVGQFVESADDGYRLRQRGRRLYRMVRAGTLTRDASLDPFDAGFDCYFCGTRVEASYEDGLLSVECPGCDHSYALAAAPPAVVEVADERDLLARLDQRSRHETLAFARGVCPTCANDLDARLVDAADAPLDGVDELDVLAHLSCGYCGHGIYVSVGELLLRDADLIAFCREHGVDVTTTPRWEFEFAMTDRHTTVRSRDPWEVALSVERGSDALELVLDGDLDVIERSRS